MSKVRPPYCTSSCKDRIDKVEAVRLRRTYISIPTKDDKPLYSPDEVASILADLGIDAPTSAARIDQLDELLRTRRFNQNVLLALIYREIDLWGEGTP